MNVDMPRLLERLGIGGLKRRDARQVWALCPMHEERTPSWSIHLDTGAHHCFGCGFGGGVVALVRARVSTAMTHDEVWRWLEREGLGATPGLPSVSAALLLPAHGGDFVMPEEVRREDWPADARDYVARRGIAGWQIARWKIGYAVEGRLRNRIVFPIEDGEGVVRGYTARSWDGSRVRYMTPHVSENADRRVLFGERWWASRDAVVLVEGAIDALAVERALRSLAAPCVAVAALGGAAVSKDRVVLAKLSRFARVVLALDDDPAGRAASEAVHAALVRRCRVHRLSLGDDDAASAAPEVLEARLSEVIG